MAFTDKGAHRKHRSGGTENRKNGEIFANTFQGKIAECAVCNYFYTKGIKNLVPDFSVSGLGKWDSVDLNVMGKEISIKSTKYFGQLLLLETKDWDENGRYIPNIEKETCEYDAFILIRIKPSCEELMKSKRWLYLDDIDETALRKLILSKIWEYDYAGFITKSDFKYIINNGYILPKGAKLNGRTNMDAENYYVQAGNLKEINLLLDYLKISK